MSGSCFSLGRQPPPSISQPPPHPQHCCPRVHNNQTMSCVSRDAFPHISWSQEKVHQLFHTAKHSDATNQLVEWTSQIKRCCVRTFELVRGCIAWDDSPLNILCSVAGTSFLCQKYWFTISTTVRVLVPVVIFTYELVYKEQHYRNLVVQLYLVD